MAPLTGQNPRAFMRLCLRLFSTIGSHDLHRRDGQWFSVRPNNLNEWGLFYLMGEHEQFPTELASDSGIVRGEKDVKRRTVRLKAGMRVRVRSTARSPIAGAEGIVTYVGDKLCDVKVILKRKGSRVEESIMDTLPKTELESVYPHVELVSISTGHTGLGWGRWTFWIIGTTLVLAATWAIVHWAIGA